ncbi:MAG: hypothetical protein ING91_19450 [Rhodocyclaceae bacterium]|jgi:hypothetical protein|nr:hypothetical protein [Rhodocyclaceae bacterium]MCA3116411.1 hypothetical protein [Rhodocyclaceae bacterium]MCA3129475.1 hypothetical protein [Rhodocyclaceae bacterium]
MSARDLKRARLEAVADLRAQPPIVSQLVLALFDAEVELLKESMLAPGAEPEDLAGARAAAMALRNLGVELMRPHRAPKDPDNPTGEAFVLDPIAGI